MSERISLAHGDGGEWAHKLIQDVFVRNFGHQKEAQLDAAPLSLSRAEIAFTTDSFVVRPIFFPGGNIGKLAVAGTVNDLAVTGAKPEYLTASFIIEEGFPISDLKSIVESMFQEAKKAGVRIVAGDTKVVERGSADGLYINTTGIGIFESEEKRVKPESIKEGDSIIISGTIGDHGIAILSARGELGIQTDLSSDCASLNHMIQDVLNVSNHVKMMRDPTRGGLATTLVEICEDFQITMEIEERSIPIKNQVHGASDILGFDPLYLANEGKIIFIVAKEDEDKVLHVLQRNNKGKDACVIGKVTSKDKGQLFITTPIGSKRRLNRLVGMQLPRIC
ncbi:hydrogenase expression/formation protein HypE [Schinkia azotoformans]|uniref:Hydrogenase expression/formation protein HypE n=1 Tax=Schinkia azotoformans LMG 9581 TaxID=1131731 RepID=K6DJ42_SCHAZ|nr:hydrogenase expression/formation protein HypE [Schinkia azotoformans]EKN68339.1 hydrogenase expression/formation protein HypE [Schinkia azotoformans LMG 9581]MEC1638547.1 hydrogenase expression/formation protein HypE [Schinkia azotoformans]MEC1946018.1 hydrogenase expression/formation protein HypE [Schinkia azotoformans]